MELYNKLFFRKDEFKYPEWIFASLGASVVALLNVAARRPIYAQLYKYPIGLAIGYGVGNQFHEWNYKRILLRETIIWDYVEKHPEQFPDLKPKKYKDILDVWHPIR